MKTKPKSISSPFFVNFYEHTIELMPNRKFLPQFQITLQLVKQFEVNLGRTIQCHDIDSNLFKLFEDFMKLKGYSERLICLNKQNIIDIHNYWQQVESSATNHNINSYR